MNGMMMKVRLTLGNGKEIGIGVSDGHYCNPRKSPIDMGIGEEYDKIEIGFPTMKDGNTFRLKGIGDDGTGMIYPYVPIQILISIIRTNGGLVLISGKENRMMGIPKKISDLLMI